MNTITSNSVTEIISQIKAKLNVERGRGQKVAAEVLGMTPSGLWQSENKGTLPLPRYFEQKKALSELGIEAPDSLWFGERAEA